MVFNAATLALDTGTDRLQFRLQVLPLDAAKPAVPNIYTLYLPTRASNISKIVFSGSEPEKNENTIWIKISEYTGACFAEIPVICQEKSGIYPMYFVSVSIFSDGEWFGLGDAALYDIKKKRWVAL